MAKKKALGKPAQKKAEVFTAEEREAMREYARERNAAARRGSAKRSAADGEKDVLNKIAEMSEPDRTMAGRIHAIIRSAAPGLTPRTWYGMPAYANGDGNVVCFFQGAAKFKSRYGTIGFSDKAHLDDGRMWPTAFALKELAAEDETRIAALVKQAAG